MAYFNSILSILLLNPYKSAAKHSRFAIKPTALADLLIYQN
ncbi:hypothetical protein [Psychrobacter sp. AH5]